VFRESGVVHSFKVVDTVLFVYESHVLYSRNSYNLITNFISLTSRYFYTKMPLSAHIHNMLLSLTIRISSFTWTLKFFVCYWRDSPRWARATSFKRFLHHTQRRITVGRTPLDEWSARPRDLYLTNTQHSQQTNVHAAGGIRTHNPNRRAAANLRLRPRGHRDQQILKVIIINNWIALILQDKMSRPFFPIHFLCLFYRLHTSTLLNWEAYSVKISLCNSDLLLFLDNPHTCNIATPRINENSQRILSLSHSFATSIWHTFISRLPLTC